MFGKQTVDVLVVGAGPVGLLTALTLARRGVQVTIIDEQQRSAAHSYALALHPESLALLAELDLLDTVTQRSRRIPKVAFFEGTQREAEVDFGRLGGSQPHVTVLRQDRFEDALEQALRAAGVNVQWRRRVVGLEPGDERVSATVDVLDQGSRGYGVATVEQSIEKTYELKARFVVGADGYRSVVRRSLGIEFQSHGPPMRFGVFEFQSSTALPDELRVVIDSHGVSALWPMPDQYCRWSFELPALDQAVEPRSKGRSAVQLGRKQYPVLSAAHLGELLAERAPWFDAGEVGEINWSMVVEFERRLAQRFGEGRCWLAGDSAHTTGPIGVQSMNIGLSEGHDLAQRLVRVIKEGGASTSLLEYGDLARARWTSLFAPDVRGDAAPGNWAQQHGAAIVPCLPVAGRQLEQAAEQLGLALAVER